MYTNNYYKQGNATDSLLIVRINRYQLRSVTVYKEKIHKLSIKMNEISINSYSTRQNGVHIDFH